MNKNKSLENLSCISGGVMGMTALWGAASFKMRKVAGDAESYLLEKLENVSDYIGSKTNEFVYDSFFDAGRKNKRHDV